MRKTSTICLAWTFLSTQIWIDIARTAAISWSIKRKVQRGQFLIECKFHILWDVFSFELSLNKVSKSKIIILIAFHEYFDGPISLWKRAKLSVHMNRALHGIHNKCFIYCSWWRLLGFYSCSYYSHDEEFELSCTWIIAHRCFGVLLSETHIFPLWGQGSFKLKQSSSLRNHIVPLKFKKIKNHLSDWLYIWKIVPWQHKHLFLEQLAEPVS